MFYFYQPFGYPLIINNSNRYKVIHYGSLFYLTSSFQVSFELYNQRHSNVSKRNILRSTVTRIAKGNVPS